MNILKLIDKNYYDTKMSRIRFRTMEAVEELIYEDLPDHKFYWAGPGWGDWDNTKTADENITRILRGDDKHIDLIVAYKPLDIYGANELHKKYKCCLIFNEMYDYEWTKKEIVEFGATLVICHHYIDWKVFSSKTGYLKNVKFKYIPHSADESAFKIWDFDGVKLPKIYDLMLVGAYNVPGKYGTVYPLRDRIAKLLPQMPNKYKWAILKHPSYELNNAQSNKSAEFFGKALNSTKIAITDSSQFHYRLGKYVEIPASGAVLACDLPVLITDSEDVDKLKQFVLEINMEMTDKQIIDTLVGCLENKQEYETKVQNGIDYAKEYTCEKYAQRFLEAIKD